MPTTPQPLTMSRSEGINIEMRQHVIAAHESEIEGENAQRDKQEAASAEQDALPSGAEQDTAVTEYPSGIKFWLAVASLCLGIFLITLVRHASSSTRWFAEAKWRARWSRGYSP